MERKRKRLQRRDEPSRGDSRQVLQVSRDGTSYRTTQTCLTPPKTSNHDKIVYWPWISFFSAHWNFSTLSDICWKALLIPSSLLLNLHSQTLFWSWPRLGTQNFTFFGSDPSFPMSNQAVFLKNPNKTLKQEMKSHKLYSPFGYNAAPRRTVPHQSSCSTAFKKRYMHFPKDYVRIF